jgi:hypothetical protein
MPLPAPNKLEKLKIRIYKNIERSGVPDDTFEVMFNPETYSLQYENVFSKAQGLNTSGSTALYQLSRPSNLNFRLIIDGTGASDYGNPAPPGEVSALVNRFLRLTAYMDGNLHEPKFLKIEWGTLVFKCRLQSVSIRYTLFDRSGKPLRAELDTSFLADVKDKDRLLGENKTSPDLTHRVTVNAGETLPMLCEKIYGSPHFYIQVARANKLTGFRNLKPGQLLFFPPIAK